METPQTNYPAHFDELNERISQLTQRLDVDVYYINKNNHNKSIVNMVGIKSRFDDTYHYLIPEIDHVDGDFIVYKDRLVETKYPTKYIKVIETTNEDDDVTLLTNSYMYSFLTEVIYYYRLTAKLPWYDDFTRKVQDLGYNKLTYILHTLEAYFEKRTKKIKGDNNNN